MRKLVFAGAAILLALQASPVLAGPAAAPQIFGGMVRPMKPATWRMPGLLADDLMHHTIAFQSSLPPGSILVRTGERRLYYILPGGEAIQYSVGVGREGFTWSGTNTVSRKAEWPDWRPPQEMIAREAAKGHTLPDSMPGGPDNPLGARAIYIGDTQFRIHGTTAPWSIGQAVSSGCIRMMNDEVIDLYDRVEVGATVVVE